MSPPDLKNRRFFSTKEAAHYLGVHVMTLRHYISDKPRHRTRRAGGSSILYGSKPPFRRFGKHCIRFPIKEFIAWANRLDNEGT